MSGLVAYLNRILPDENLGQVDLHPQIWEPRLYSYPILLRLYEHARPFNNNSH